MVGVWDPLELPDSIVSKRFYVCIRNTANGRQVTKLPRGDTELSCSLLSLLKERKVFEEYADILTSVKLDPWLRDHCVAVSRIKPDGGYTSEYVEGMNLAQLRDELLKSEALPGRFRRPLTDAIKRLLGDLTGYYSEHRKLIGDWFMHNLIFSPERQSIINVDTEGFFSYKNDSAEAYLPCIEANLLALTELITLMDSSSQDGAKILDVFSAVDKVRRSGKQYSGTSFVAGYHSLELYGKRFRGQRDCPARLAQVPFDFRDRVVLDLGCNVGGMLHSLSKVISTGYGIDANPDCISAAELIKHVNNSSNLEFSVFDLDRQSLSELGRYFERKEIDICFFLSMCKWLEHWQEVVCQASQLARVMLFESNGTTQEQEEQIALVRRCFKKVDLICEKSDDDFVRRDRKLFLCTQDA